jgi:hypothetical protein
LSSPPPIDRDPTRGLSLRACPCGDWHARGNECPALLDQAVDSVAWLLADYPDAVPAPVDYYQLVLDELDA